MRKKSINRTQRTPLFYFVFSVITFFAGIIVAVVTTTVLAQTTTNTINACVNKNTGFMRVLSEDDTCRQAESSLSWNIQGPPGPPGADNGMPYTCNGCTLFAYAQQFRDGDFTRAQIFSTEFQGADLTGVIFKEAHLRNVGFRDTNLTGADFSDLSKNILDSSPPVPNPFTSSGLNFRNANLTNATFAGSFINNNFDFRSANLQNTNFSNTRIRQSNFLGALNASTANFTGAIWESSTCPDGTNSDNNGNTCIGHL